MKVNVYNQHCFWCDCEPQFEVDAETGDEEEILCPNCGGKGHWKRVTPVYEYEVGDE